MMWPKERDDGPVDAPSNPTPPLWSIKVKKKPVVFDNRKKS